MYERAMFFIDGENLVLRYQDMLTKGYEPNPAILYEKDVYVWHKDVIRANVGNIIRVNYYTSAQASYEKIDSLSGDIKKIEYHYQGPPVGTGGRLANIHHENLKGHIVPHIFKKKEKEARSRLVDISITIDMLHYASLQMLDAVYLISCDGDYIPLIKEVMRRGVKVYLMALSIGLNPKLPISGDEFECIDSRLLRKIDNK
ncbi:MAG: NYN domain-containing protein [Planctomycetota bacterium]|jgi:uncharacterized LabA/DUF88 family protein